MELVITIGWLLSLTTAAKAAPVLSSLCINSVPCKCTRVNENRLIVDCSKMNLTNIPSIPNDTIFLSLRNNKITVVENRTFSNLPHLVSLDLSKNSIQKIDLDGFQGLVNLEHLDLNRNNVPLTTDGFKIGVFQDLKNISYLSIQNINSRRDNSSYPHEIFAGLISLTTLKIDGKFNAIFGPEFSKLFNLRVLKLASDNCFIENIYDNTFINLPFLTDLDISQCHIQMIEPGAFIPLKHLRYLDISYNGALGLDGLRNASFGLINGSISILKANKLYPTFHLSVPLKGAHLEFLQQTNIKELYLDENHIEFIELEYDNILPISTKKVSIAGNKFTSDFDIIQLFLNSSITFINVSGNSLNKLSMSLFQLQNLKIFDASDNLCSNVMYGFVFNVNNFESLFLGDNLLGLILATDSKGRIFGKLTNLRTLVLSNNQITSLPFQIFSGLHNLEHLDLSRNYLHSFDIQTDQMMVTHLNLSRNLLNSLPASVRNELTDQANIKNITVDLTDNPLQCDCSSLEFMKWVNDEKSRVTFVGFDSYTCQINGNEHSFKNLENLILGLDKTCANYTVAIWILSISITLFVIVLTAGIMYRYRWILRYLYYMTRRRYRGYGELYENDRENYQFDAFLSYADNNLRFVKFTLLPNLEVEGLHLCIHHRDFLPGEEIASNIANAIHQSRKTVVLLDDDFLCSYWCMYELNMARMESIYSRKGKNILILLVKEEMDKSKLPLELLDLIHKETYIELPEDLVDIDITDICSRLRETIID
ncbi:hypothetical protein CHS0354_006071 [Potamilus streckersoni]|uniref:TIR domain-containing protein n=1 Tax=Potamilus streckersoni TaxID=2493646 RepID=A0AAE0SUC3_9BIVA|nr:hypothetical protein CHS0354_006071 [Potamilus streckersoni]